MGSHSVTCHPTEVTFQPLPHPNLVLDLAIPEGCKAELTWLAGYVPWWRTRPKTVTHPSTNRDRRRVTSFMRRTMLTTTPRHQPCRSIYASSPLWYSVPWCAMFCNYVVVYVCTNCWTILLLTAVYRLYSSGTCLSMFLQIIRRRRVCLKPNSITLSSSKVVRSWSQTDSKLVGDQLRTSFEPDSVMKFGREPASSC